MLRQVDQTPQIVLQGSEFYGFCRISCFSRAESNVFWVFLNGEWVRSDWWFEEISLAEINKKSRLRSLVQIVLTIHKTIFFLGGGGGFTALPLLLAHFGLQSAFQAFFPKATLMSGTCVRQTTCHSLYIMTQGCL